MKIANQKMDVPKTSGLNDKDQMTRCLATLKELAKNYTVALTEASNEELFKRYLEQFNNIIKMQRDIYELMFRYGWYELKTADQKEIENAYTNLIEDYNSVCN